MSKNVEIIEFGPYRVIGMRYIGKNENGEIPALWGGENGFIKRAAEIAKSENIEKIAFGLCRCIPDVTDGTFEYIAAVPVSEDAQIPTDMVEVMIPAGTYAAFPIESLNALDFEQLGTWLELHPEWDGFCTPTGCDCATHPNFEMYPETFCTDGKLFIYMPIRKK